MATEDLMILREVEKNCNTALEIISSMRDDPMQHLVDLMQVLYQMKEKAENPRLENLRSFLCNSIQLLEKLTHLETSEQELNKFIYIVSRIVYELTDRIDALIEEDLDLSRKLEVSSQLDNEEETHRECESIESDTLQMQSFVAFECLEKKYLIETKHVEKILPWDYKLEHQLPVKSLGFLGGMVYCGALIPILGGNKSIKDKQGKSLVVCQIAEKQFVVVSNKAEAILQIPKKQVLSLEAGDLQVCDEVYTIFSLEALEAFSGMS